MSASKVTKKTIDNGGPAFPEPFLPHRSGLALNTSPGMTLRDYFAGQALAGAFAADAASRICDAGLSYATAAETLAEGAYIAADAMIARRGMQP